MADEKTNIIAGGCRYIKARPPNLYKDIIGKAHISEQKVIWLDMGK